MLGLSRGASRDENDTLREEIEAMVLDNAAQINSSAKGETPTTQAPTPSPGVAPRVNVVARSGTRASISNVDTEGAAFVCEGALDDQQL